MHCLPWAPTRGPWRSTLVLLLSTPGAVAAQMPSWVSPIGGAEQAVRRLGDSSTLRVPLELSLPLALQPPRLVDVALDGFRNEQLFGAVTVALDSGDLPALLLTLDMTELDSVSRPDTLDVRIELTGRGAAPTAGGPPVDSTKALDLRVRTAPAVLAQPGTMRIWGTSSDSALRSTLTLRETSGESGIARLSVTSLPFAGPENRPTNVRVVLDTAEVMTIPAGGNVMVPLRVEGSPPLGTATGQIEVDARQLSTPLAVEVEILTRRSLAWLFWFILAGLGIGYVGRTYLQRLKDLAAAQERAEQVMRRLCQVLKTHHDEDFGHKVELLRAAIKTAQARRNPAAITKAVDDADSGLTTALTTLERDLNAQIQVFEPLAKLLAARWQLPREADAVMEDARAHAEEVRKALELADAGQAEGGNKTIRTKLTSDLRTELVHWQAQLPVELKRVDDLRHGLPKSVVSELDQPVQDFLTQVKAVDPPTPGDNVAAIETALEKVEDCRVSFDAVVRSIPQGTQAEFDDVNGALGQPSDPAPIEELAKGIQGLVVDVAAATELEDALNAALDDKLAAAWEKAILAQVPSGADPKKVKALIDEHDYVAAAIEAKASAPKMELVGSPRLAAAPTKERPRKQETPPALRIPVQERPYLLPPVEVRGWCLLFAAKFLQWIILAAVIAVAGLVILGDDFVGTFSDLATAFLWGFSLDVTADVSVETVKSMND